MDTLRFTRRQRRAFAHIFRAARAAQGLTQLEVARAAFGYRRSHCKVSRVERAVMAKVDAVCVSRLAQALRVPRTRLEQVDETFGAKLRVAKLATKEGLWPYRADLV
jgi:transcriptional regulator with XRE-family HTH domain